MVKKHFWLVAGIGLVIISVTCFFYRISDQPRLRTIVTSTTSSTSSGLEIANLSELFNLFKNKERTQTAMVVSHWERVFTIYSEKLGVPYVTEIIVVLGSDGSRQADEFFVIHTIAYASNLPIYGPFHGNVPNFIREAQKLKPGQVVGSDFKVQSISFPENSD
jgi:hypothetical protein